MNTNPYLAWPLWHFFSLHMQNIAKFDDDFRRLEAPRGAVSVAEADALLANVARDIFVYDFMADRIVRGSDVRELHVMSIRGLVQKEQRDDVLTLVKRLSIEKEGVLTAGEYYPFVGTPRNMRKLILEGYGKVLKGEEPTGIAELRRQANLDAMMAAPKYKDTAIVSILESYRKVAEAPPADISINSEKYISDVSKRIGTTILENKAVNTTGKLVDIVNRSYDVVEYAVENRVTGATRVMKFAFTKGMNPRRKEQYLQILKDVFNAKPVEATTPSDRQRRLTETGPITLSPEAAESLFGPTEGFDVYRRSIARIAPRPVDRTQIATGRPPVEEEEEEEELEDFEDEEDLEEL